MKAAVTFIFAQMVNPWTRPFRTSIELQHRAFDVAEQTGNPQIACYTLFNTDHPALNSGTPLREVERAAEDGLAFARRAKFGLAEDILLSQLRLDSDAAGIDP